jgi:alkyl hydroperoxide reductase subunit AhpF
MLVERLKSEISKKFAAELQGPVTLLLFTSELASETCSDTKLLLRDITELTDKVDLKIHNFVLDKDEVAKFGIDKIPAIIVLGEQERDYGIRFFGLPGGYELASLISSIIQVSQDKTLFSDETKQKIEAITSPLHLQVFVTPT